MLGYDVNWASFHIIELMSSSKIHLKIVGYLVAAQSFHEDTDVLMLTTNLIKKDLSPSPAEVAITLNRLSSVVTPDVARDIGPEVFIMLNHSHPHIRKRAVLTLYRGIIWLQERLDDPDPGVVSVTANTQSSGLSPPGPCLFHLLTTSSNNWMPINPIKLVCVLLVTSPIRSLSPHEPWLVKKLQPPITNLISTTTAISLLYKCVHMCIIGNMLRGPSGLSLAQTCISKLADQNHRFKYIALLALVKIVPTHVDLVVEYQDVILASMDDDDISIRMRALELVTALVNKHNLQSIVQQLFSHLVQPQASMPSAVRSSSQHVVPSIPLRAPSAPSHSPAYHLWDLSTLIDLTYISGVDIGTQIRGQLIDVVERLMVKLLSDETLSVHAGEPGSCSEVLWAAAWICGEYCSGLLAPEELLPYLLHSEVANLDPDTVAVYLQAATKVFGYWSTEAAQQWTDDLLDKVKGAVDSMMERLEDFISSPHIEVQERAANIHRLFAFVKHDLTTYRPKLEPTFSDGYSVSLSVFDTPEIDSTTAFPKSLYLIHSLFSAYELNPVASAAQASIPVPVGLDLDTWISPSIQSEVLVEKKVKKKSKKGKEKESPNGTRSKGMKKKKEDEEVLVPLEEIAERERMTKPPNPVDDVDSIPIVQLDELPPPMPKVEPRLFALKSSSVCSKKVGERPAGAMPATPQSRSAPIARQPTPSLFETMFVLVHQSQSRSPRQRGRAPAPGRRSALGGPDG
ncbi:adaptin N terminal region-domain-containing protein [Pisolithus microcarpus]|nr:adaptin N terminal region-domain-containing protein [Pisolithus microcarpus]